jgi:hypothetical protein
MKFSLVSATVVVVAMIACSASDDAPKQPLGAPAASAADAPAGPGGPVLSQAAKDALDAGNFAYRAKQYALAIDKYREAAVAAPAHAAPWFGVYMAANELKNAALADSAMARVKTLSADPEALDAHANAAAAPTTLPPGHPSTQTQLPPDHPTVKPKLPDGHPAPVKKP